MGIYAKVIKAFIVIAHLKIGNVQIDELKINLLIYTYIYIYMRARVCMCVCVYMCVSLIAIYIWTRNILVNCFNAVSFLLTSKILLTSQI